MRVAETFAELSHCERAKVGAIIVKADRIIMIGYNGMPAGYDNCCEDTIHHHELGTTTVISKSEVLHAEANAIAKLAQSSESSVGAVMFCTHTPCMECAKLIHQAGIKKVYYRHDYNARKGSGIDFLSDKLEKV